MPVRQETEAMRKLLLQVGETGNSAGKWALVNAAIARKLIEPDRQVGHFILYRLTDTGRTVLATM